MGAPVVHFEVVSKGEPKEVQKFYSDLFGWNIDADNPLQYGLVAKEEAGGVAGGVAGNTDPAMNGHVTFYMGVDDPDVVLKEVEARGGTIVLPTTEVVPGTTIALFTDPWGSLIGLSKL
jgi:predicted enzyme related to lactoylglutathione lyase